LRFTTITEYLAGPETKRHVCTQIKDLVAALSANISNGKDVVEGLFTTLSSIKEEELERNNRTTT
jgi:hypothetical protein